ncbi:hypothetical protein [Paragemmobacter ruber]|uniref:DUF4169 family protein n=1 Tax=Paragemmobacter ruber TaxID=1985673 RepID=A0ABW9Y1V4_9RHOB|nr:hypothetical protein [Rhodobacter ruber]NBE06471.1 hypothetical protein [Rhodobacter ruber]
MNPKSSDPRAETTGAEKAGPGKTGRPTSETTREARLKAALKANMARRKAQARARAGNEAKAAGTDTPPAEDM